MEEDEGGDMTTTVPQKALRNEALLDLCRKQLLSNQTARPAAHKAQKQ